MQYSDFIAHIADAAWLVMIMVWIVSAFTAKRYVKRSSGRWSWLIYRLVTIVIIILLIEYGHIPGSIFLAYIANPVVRSIGALLVVLGVAVAIWARYHLGRNWGMPVSEKEGAELVTSGPYAYIRNPIYSGILLAGIGSALVFGAIWVLITIMFGIYFFYGVFGEEKIMARLFPDTYPAYKARTKRLIPWVW